MFGDLECKRDYDNDNDDTTNSKNHADNQYNVFYFNFLFMYLFNGPKSVAWMLQKGTTIVKGNCYTCLGCFCKVHVHGCPLFNEGWSRELGTAAGDISAIQNTLTVLALMGFTQSG